MAEIVVLSEELANMSDPSGTCYHLNEWFLDTFGQTTQENLVENFKIGLPEPNLDFGTLNSIISPP
jgi:hypothetical protein